MSKRMDPGKPERMRQVHARRRAERMIAVEDMVNAGRTFEEICAHYGIGAGALERWLSRHGRSDLLSQAKGDPEMAQRMRWKLQAKARLGLPANCSDHDFYRAVALALKAEDIIANPDARPENARRAKRARQDRLAAKRRRAHPPDLPTVLSERFPDIHKLSEEAA